MAVEELFVVSVHGQPGGQKGVLRETHRNKVEALCMYKAWMVMGSLSLENERVFV